MRTAGAEFSAPILDALGKREAADVLRWSDEPLDELAAQRDTLAGEVERLTELLDKLDGLLCARCAGKWEKAQAS